MFDWLKEKPDHPMYSLDEAVRLVGDVSKADSAKTLTELTSCLTSVKDTPGFRPEVRASVVKFLDESAQLHERKIFAAYLAQSHLRDGRGKMPWQLVHDFWNQLGEAYRVCLADYRADADAATEAAKSDLPVLAAREMRARAHAIKLLQMRYQPLPDATWPPLYEAYSDAEAMGYAAKSVRIYPAEEPASSPRAEFLKALMLEAAYTDNMAPEQIELAFRTASRFASAFLLARQPEAGTTFIVDLAKPLPPRPISLEDGPGDGLRCFGAGLALPKIEDMVKQNEQGLIAHEQRLGTEHSSAQKVTVLKHLLLYWGEKPPHREKTRLKISGEVSIVHGYRNVCDYIVHIDFSAMGEIAEGMDVKLKERSGFGLVEHAAKEPPETWMQQDASDWGVGATVPPQVGKWVAVGSLCAVKPAGGQAWWAAVVRRLQSDAHNRTNAGIEILAKKPMAVWLRALGQEDAKASNWETTSGAFTYDYLHAVMLSDHARAENRPVLLLEKDRFAPNQIYEMMVGDKSRHVILRSFLEQGEDYDLGSFDWYQPQDKRAA